MSEGVAGNERERGSGLSGSPLGPRGRCRTEGRETREKGRRMRKSGQAMGKVHGFVTFLSAKGRKNDGRIKRGIDY